VTKIAGEVDQADMVWDWVVAEDGMRFHKAYGELGLNQRLPRYTSSDGMYSNLLFQVGPTAVGTQILANWFPEIEVPQSRDFVQKLKQRFNADADWYHASGYHDGQVVLQVLDKMGGRVEDGQAFLNELLNYQSKETILGGDYRFNRELKTPYLNMYLAEVVEAPGGGIARKIIDTLPGINPKF
jgi:branched-chain amino acid transport system substrate-binding protein